MSRLTTEEKEIGSYKGFNLKVAPTIFATGYKLSAEGEREYRVDISADTDIGSIRKLENLVDKIPKEATSIKEEIEVLKDQKESIEEQLNEPFKQEEQLMNSLKRQVVLNLEIEADLKMDTTSKEVNAPTKNLDRDNEYEIEDKEV